MENILLIAVLVLVLGGATWYVYRAKKRGQKCIGCPDAGCCSKHCDGCCSHKAQK